MKRKNKITIVVILSVLLLLIISVILCNFKVSENGRYTYDSVNDVPYKYAAILLGTSKSLSNGQKNNYFYYRCNAAAELFKNSKCSKIIVSGDNGHSSYNEPEDMRQELLRLGVPNESIVCDYAGFRTLDSIVRMNAIFGQKDGIVVSQQFHNERAIYIGRSKGIELIGYNAKDVTSYRGIKVKIREVFSRFVCVMDVNIFYTQPKFYGEKIKL